MSGNTWGRLFCVTTFGESHGPALGAVVDGCPPGLPLSIEDIQPDLDRRKPGTSRHVTQRREGDQVEILSGVFEGLTTGTHPSHSSSKIPINVAVTMRRLPSSFALVMPTILTCRNMVTAITAAADAHLPEKLLRVWLRGPLPASGWQPVMAFAFKAGFPS